MIKKTLYPKTRRVGGEKFVQVAEKLDGSNLCLFKFQDDLYVAQRNNVYKALDVLDGSVPSKVMYKGLHGYLNENLDELTASLNETSCICCEWMGMGRLKYPDLMSRLYMFAKANVTGESIEEIELKNLYYNHELFKWCFVEQEVPALINRVPIVAQLTEYPMISTLDDMYSSYEERVGREVEGFVILYDGKINKYVRKKDGKSTDHMEKRYGS